MCSCDQCSVEESFQSSRLHITIQSRSSSLESVSGIIVAENEQPRSVFGVLLRLELNMEGKTSLRLMDTLHPYTSLSYKV